MHAGVGDTVVTLISKVLHRHYHVHVLEDMLCCSDTFHHTQHILHLTDGRLESTSGANALMLMPDKLKLPNPEDNVEHDPFLVSRPEGSTRKMQSPKKAAPSSPHRLPGLHLHHVNKGNLFGKSTAKGLAYPSYWYKRLNCSSFMGRQERPWLLPRNRYLMQRRIVRSKYK